MDRFFIILCCLISFQLSASPLQPSHIDSITKEIQTVQVLIDNNQLHLISDHAKNKLLNHQQVLTQIFADAQVSLAEKNALLSHSQLLSDVLLALGESVVRVDHVFERSEFGSGTGIIRGFVRDASNGNPINSAIVTVYTQSGVYVGYDYTDDVGRYAITNLPPGHYILLGSTSQGLNYQSILYDEVACQGGLGVGCQANEGTAIEVVSNQVVESINFNLKKYGKITGQVVDQLSNQPVNANIAVFDANFNQVASTNTSYSTGMFSVMIPGLGDHYLRISSSYHNPKMYDDVSCDQQNCDLNLATPFQVGLEQTLDLGVTTLVQNSVMSGRVVDANTGLPLNNVYSVEIYDAMNGYYIDSEYPDNQGYWTSDPLPPGTYHVRNRAPGYLAQYYLNHSCANNSYNSCLPIEADEVVHASNNTNDINFQLQPGGKIIGVIKDYQNNPTDARVWLYNDQGDSLDYVYTDANGNYQFSGLENGTYYISASNSAHQVTLHSSVLCQSVSYSNRCTTATQGNPIVISASATVTKDVRMKTGHTITGFVRDTSNDPLEHAYVSLISDQESYYVNADNNGYYKFKKYTGWYLSFTCSCQ